MQYFYDQEKTSLTINDFVFPSAKYGIAVGYVAEGKREDPTQLVTSDGGDHWELSPLKEMPISLFFLDDSLGWMVTTKGLWRTTEAGRNWTKLPKIPGDILRVCFTSEKDGYAVGLKKLVLQTHDGGQTWTPVKEAADQPGDPHYSAYVWVAFATPKTGLIAGTNNPPRRFAPYFPDWLDPAATLRMREVPHLSYTLVTVDGGETWRPKSASLLGQTARFRLNPDGKGIGLIEFSELSASPSEVYTIDWHTGVSRSVYKNRENKHHRRLVGWRWHGVPGGNPGAGTPARHHSREGRRSEEPGLSVVGYDAGRLSRLGHPPDAGRPRCATSLDGNG